MATMDRMTALRHAARVVGALTLIATVGGCNNLLDVDRPGLITDDQIAANKLVSGLVAAATGEYHIAFNWTVNSGAAATDEVIFAHGWSPWEDYDERDIVAGGCPHDCIGYGWMQQARVSSVRATQQLKAMQAPATAIATTLAYAGYSTVLLADYLCEVPLNGGAPLTRAVAYDSAIALFQEAVTVAASDPYLTNLARVGMARSYLNRNDLDNAIAVALQVDPAFVAWVRYVDSPVWDDWINKYNLYYRTSGFFSPSEFSLAIDPADSLRVDLRVPFDVDSTRRMFSSKPEPRYGLVPFTPRSFENWTPGNTRMIQGGDDIQFASGLEAQYVIAEASLYGGAGGWSLAQDTAFINARRAVGGLGPYAGAFAVPDVQAELREQRKMDFYFAGYRMPDLIRYQTYYSVDLWPTGKLGGFPPSATYTYGSTECWPVGTSETSTNPNFP